MKYDTLKALVNSKVYENTEQRITGGDMNDVLQSAIASLGAHYQMGGLVSPTDQITVGDEPVVFLATTHGTYTYFGGLVVADGEVALLVWSGTAWSKQTPDIATRTEVSQLGQKVDADISELIDLSTTIQNANAGYVYYSNGRIAPWTTYPQSRYTNPIKMYPGDEIYIKANVGTTLVAVISFAESADSVSFAPVQQGTNTVAEYRYVCTKEIYVVISTYAGDNISSGVWQLIKRTSSKAILGEVKICEKYGNNTWATNPSASATTLDAFENLPTQLTRRMVYGCVRSAQFFGVDKSVKRTLQLLWNGYADYFRVAISKCVNSAWVSDYDSNNIPISEINPEHNRVLNLSLGNGAVKLLIDTSIFGYLTNYSGVLNKLSSQQGFVEPELIFADTCYQEEPEIVIDAIKTTTPRIYPNALLPCVSFEFDDNALNDDLVVDLFDELGLRCNFAFIASEANISDYGDKYLDWHRRGYGICSHSVDGVIFNTTNYTRETALAALQTSKNRLQNKGFVVNGFVAPSSQMADEFLDLVKETYGYGFTANDGYSGQRRGNPCRQIRQSMESGTLSYVKGRIDIAIAFGYNFTFYGHSANFGTTYSGEEWNITKLRAILEYAIAKRDAGQLFIGNSDECMDYFYGGNFYNEHFSGACGTIQPKNRYHYYLHNVTSATIAYSANLPAECEIMLETDTSYTSGITFGSGYKFASVPTFGAGETWYIKIVQGCVIATKMI